MLGFILLKMKNKYKLYTCLFLGMVFMLATFSLISFYGNGAMEKLINDGFYESYEKNGDFPAVLSRNDIVKRNRLEAVKGTVKSYENSWNKYLSCPVLATEYIYTLKGCPVELSYKGKGGYLDIAYIEGGGFNAVDGLKPDELGTLSDDFYEYNSLGEKGVYPCVISRKLMDFYNLVVGERITFTNIKDESGNVLTFEIAGIVEEEGFDDYTWYKSLTDISLTIYTDEASFDEIAEGFNFNAIVCENYELIDYRYINPQNAETILDYIEQFYERDEKLDENISVVLKNYMVSRRTVKTILYVIIIPLLILMIIFISMISVRIVDSERTEIAALRSRGLSSAKILKMYVFQVIFLSLFAYIFGILLGYGLFKIAGRVDGFLSISKSIKVYDSFTYDAFIYALFGACLSGILQLIPVIFTYKDTVLDIKHKKLANLKKPGWERGFADVILLLVSSYMIYDFNKQLEAMRLDTLSGKGLDPMIFVSSTIFMVAVGLLFLRVLGYTLRLIFKLFNKRLKTSDYASFLQVIRNRKKSDVISIFMVITIASSIFNATVARTVNENLNERIRYNVGTNLVYKEKWKVKLAGMVPPLKWRYDEPEYDIYNNLVKEGYAKGVTKVIRDDKATAQFNNKKLEDVTLLGINTKEFGETAFLKDGLTDIHWFNYLNNLAVKTNGVIISKNLAEYYSVKEGDTIGCLRYPPPEALDKEGFTSAYYEVVGIVDAFPGYKQYESYADEDGNMVEKESYLMVINYANAVSVYGITPYELWISTDNADRTRSYLDERLAEQNRDREYYINLDEEIVSMNSSAVIQITNGLFTINFLLSILLSVIGFLIFQITELRDRQSLFGVYRAMGISMREINRMLFIEVFGVLFSGILAGAFSGFITTIFYIRIFSTVYLPQRHNVPVGIYTDVWDFLRLGIILIITFAVCFVIIRRIVKKLKITEVIKLGED